jgi:hypothetical protein
MTAADMHGQAIEAADEHITRTGDLARPVRDGVPCGRRCSRITGRIFSVACSQRAKYQYTVCRGGMCAGSCRHEHPARTMYKITSTIAWRVDQGLADGLPSGCFTRPWSTATCWPVSCPTNR